MKRNVGMFGLALALIVHAASCVWWGAKLTAATEHNTSDIVSLQSSQKDKVDQRQFDDLKESTSARLADINSKLDILLTRGSIKQ